MALFNYYHLPWVARLREMARSLGLIPVLARLPGRAPVPEAAFQTALQSSIHPGDVVWDIGASTGRYTREFCAWTGPGGKVVAFEPSPTAFARLQESLAGEFPPERYLLCAAAVTDFDGEATFEPDGDDVSTILHLVDSAGKNVGPGLKVEALRVDSAAVRCGAPSPQVTKIDVEGYEEEVLRGGVQTFSAPSHRALFVEVHFERLSERGRNDAPARIVRLLKSWGYRVEWVDVSHLRAARR